MRVTRIGASFIAVLALVALLAPGCGGSGGGSDKAAAKYGRQPVVKTTAAEAKIGNVIPTPPPRGQRADPDTYAKGGADGAWVIRALGNDRYELTVQNTSRVGYIETFDWRPPVGATVKTVGKSSAGSCALVGELVHCDGLHLKPPKCLCRPGGSETVVFTMHNPNDNLGIEGSGLVIRDMTPILKNIPSTPGPEDSGL
jgi:hypothetical protein